ncbi:hypothetical protein HZA98_04840 [Candidatus Woesearchaeota archaeon]|nr:hypothetical protein [Candidatus Woesearchaeota archaeon]
MTTTQLSVKEVDKNTFREFKAESTREGLKIGQALTLAMQQWLKIEKKKQKRSFLDFKPKPWGKGTERISEETDKALYQ